MPNTMKYPGRVEKGKKGLAMLDIAVDLLWLRPKKVGAPNFISEICWTVSCGLRSLFTFL